MIVRPANLELDVAEATRRLSDLPGRVAHAGETIVITRRGRPIAKLVPAIAPDTDLFRVGWLEDDDPFLDSIERIVAARRGDRARVARRGGRRKPGQ